MKLQQVLDNLNSFEKNNFLKVISDIIAREPKNLPQIEEILATETSRELKNIDSLNVSKVFALVSEEFEQYILELFEVTTSQTDILIDILIRDGNCIMRQEWFSRLYEKEIKHIKSKVESLASSISAGSSDIDNSRLRDYTIYKKCLQVAYTNDDANNLDRKVTVDEQSILTALSEQLELSQEEVKLINYMIVPIKPFAVDDVINDLKSTGIAFFSKKQNTIYVADEVVRILRKVRGKVVADKFFRRVLRTLRESQINLICKKHNIDRKLSLNEKIKEIINEGISFTGALSQDIYKPTASLTDRKKFINELWQKKLQIQTPIKGVTLEDKINSLVEYFNEVEKDEKVGISIDGYDKLISDLKLSIPEINSVLKLEFELQGEQIMNVNTLLAYNIKPRDILELIPTKKLSVFCNAHDISTRGNEIMNILDAYKDSENLFIENYEHIGYRDLKTLKDNGIQIKESDLGLKFEDITKTILTRLGFNIDETLRKRLNTSKDKIDIIINLGNNELILIECKTVKESGYNKFSSVSRQLKSYAKLIHQNDFKVIKSLLVAPAFSDDFISDCELEYELNLSLLSASALAKIYLGLKESKHDDLPYKLLMRDVVIDEQRVLRAIQK